MRSSQSGFIAAPPRALDRGEVDRDVYAHYSEATRRYLMAIVPNRPAAVVRRYAGYSLVADVVLALLAGIIFTGFVGLVVFIVGLAAIGFVYYNFRQVMRTRGY